MIALILAALLLSDGAVPMNHNGVPGLWLPAEMAREYLTLVETEPKQRLRIKLADERDALATRELLTARIALNDSREQSTVLQSQLERSIARGNSIWRSPILWFVTGMASAVVGILIAR